MTYQYVDVATVMCDALDITVATVPQLYHEKFEHVGHVHDWRNYVDSNDRQNWKQFNDLQRLAKYIAAKVQSSSEVWD